MLLNLGGSGGLLCNPEDPPSAPSLAPSIASAAENRPLPSATAFAKAAQASRVGAVGTAIKIKNQAEFSAR